MSISSPDMYRIIQTFDDLWVIERSVDGRWQYMSFSRSISMGPSTYTTAEEAREVLRRYLKPQVFYFDENSI